MGKFFFKFDAGGIRHALVFDIASSSVGVALITHSHKKSTLPKTLHTYRTPIKFTAEANKGGANALASSLASALTLTVESARQALTIQPKVIKSFDIHVVVHAPWAESASQSASKTFEQPQKITKGLLHKFIQSSFPNITQDDPNLIAAHITGFTLNDYTVREPLGKTIQKIAASILISSMHQSIKSTIVSILSEAFGARTLHFNTFVYVASVLANSTKNKHKEYILADIGGEYLELYVMRDDSIQAKTSLEFGGNYLLRTINDVADAPLAMAKSKFIMFNENTCTLAERRSMRQRLAQTEADWTKNFGEACAKLSQKSHIPDKVFLSSSRFAYDWFAKIMGKIDFAQFTSTSKPLSIAPLIDNTGTTQRDTRLLLASLFVDKYNSRGIYDKLFMIQL